MKRVRCASKMRAIWAKLLHILVLFLLKNIDYAEGMDVPALFVFGDSLLDTGNNNYLRTVARANAPPYGQDYHNGPPGGRFSNGAITTDFIASALNLPCPPAYAIAGDNIERGVNFASAGTGILNVTGDAFGQHYSMDKQVMNFEDVKNRLVMKLGSEQSSSIISRAIFYITVGSNDYLVTYYSIPRNPKYAFLSRKQFAHLLISTLTTQIQSLYDKGARKFAVTSVPNMGCMPFALRLYPHNPGECISFLNVDAVVYNKEFFATIQQLQAQYPDAHFISNNAYAAAMTIYHKPASYGIVNLKDACCNLGNSIQGVCLQGFQTCANASQYYFFDGFHPTSLVHKLTADRYISGGSPYVSPYNLEALASL